MSLLRRTEDWSKKSPFENIILRARCSQPVMSTQHAAGNTSAIEDSVSQWIMSGPLPYSIAAVQEPEAMPRGR